VIVPVGSDGATDRQHQYGRDAETVHHSDEIHPAGMPPNALRAWPVRRIVLRLVV
jgi:hypothetical protein